MSIATGQFTIIDYNDALTLTGFIGSSQPKTQLYHKDNESYTPNWGTLNQVLTPSLFIMGNGSDIITSDNVTAIQWFQISGGVETEITNSTDASSYSIAAAKPKALTILKNILAGLSAKDFVCKVTYHDPTTGLDLYYKTPITLNLVTDGGGLVDAVVWCPNGNAFKNGSINTLTIQCDLWRGSTIDVTSVEYKWYMQDSSVVTSQGAGVGWKLLSDSAGSYTGTATNTITVYDAAVTNFAVFKCQVKDIDTSSPTYYGITSSYYYDVATLLDMTDPITLQILSSGGDVFKNGSGTTTLTAQVWRAGVNITANYTGTQFKWYKYNNDASLDANFGGAGINYKTGLTLSVGGADVDVKATFKCELS
jgi:hypothetical protein